MVDTALSTMLAFFGLVRSRAVLEEFRARAQGHPARAGRTRATRE
jgi:hypothetical protein